MKQLSTEERIRELEAAIEHFNKLQREDLTVSQEMRLDFIHEFRATRRAIFIVTAMLVAALVLNALTG